MSGEFNIYKNLDELKKTNLLAQMNLESAATNRSPEEDEFDFESLLNNNTVKSPIKRQRKKASSCTPEKKKKNEKSRRSSSSKERSISPVMPLLENLINKVDEVPVGRRTRKSLNLAQSNATALLQAVLDEEQDVQKSNGTSSRGRGRAKVRGKGTGGRGRGRGRGKTINSNESHECPQNSSSDMSENLESITSSSNDVSEQETDTPASSSSLMERFVQQGQQGRKRVMRARRSYISEVAARATNVDYVDLITSPWPRVEGTIVLGSDDEEPAMTTRSKKKSAKEKPFTINASKAVTSTAAALNISFDEENPEMSVKITWKGKPESFLLRKYQKFSTIFMELAKRENTDIENLVFNINNRIILPDDTPDSIDYKIYQFINGRVLASRFNSPLAAASKKRDSNKIKLKIQSDKLKRPLQIDIMKADKFRILFIKCSEELNVGIDQLKLSFDGELLDANDTPADLDLEGGEAIDLRIQN